jgi:thiol-disulfide isomerase/thioredoxin
MLENNKDNTNDLIVNKTKVILSKSTNVKDKVCSNNIDFDKVNVAEEVNEINEVNEIEVANEVNEANLSRDIVNSIVVTLSKRSYKSYRDTLLFSSLVIAIMFVVIGSSATVEEVNQVFAGLKPGMLKLANNSNKQQSNDKLSNDKTVYAHNDKASNSSNLSNLNNSSNSNNPNNSSKNTDNYNSIITNTSNISDTSNTSNTSNISKSLAIRTDKSSWQDIDTLLASTEKRRNRLFSQLGISKGEYVLACVSVHCGACDDIALELNQLNQKAGVSNIIAISSASMAEVEAWKNRLGLKFRVQSLSIDSFDDSGVVILPTLIRVKDGKAIGASETASVIN